MYFSSSGAGQKQVLACNILSKASPLTALPFLNFAPLIVSLANKNPSPTTAANPPPRTTRPAPPPATARPKPPSAPFHPAKSASLGKCRHESTRVLLRS
jgi:hypothetical protein